MLTSYPALQGVSGAPAIAKVLERKQFVVAGVLVASSGRHLLPAQVVTIEDGSSYRESTSYFLPYGKAVSWSVITHCLEGMNIPFEQIADDPQR